MAGKYYVLMLHCNPGCHLTTTGTLERAKWAVRWQCGHAPDPTYPICQYDPATKTFNEIDGDRRSLTIQRGPYTEKAYAEFLASLPA